jgi:hypothetical protein
MLRALSGLRACHRILLTRPIRRPPTSLGCHFTLELVKFDLELLRTHLLPLFNASLCSTNRPISKSWI